MDKASRRALESNNGVASWHSIALALGEDPDTLNVNPVHLLRDLVRDGFAVERGGGWALTEAGALDLG